MRAPHHAKGKRAGSESDHVVPKKVGRVFGFGYRSWIPSPKMSHEHVARLYGLIAAVSSQFLRLIWVDHVDSPNVRLPTTLWGWFFQNQPGLGCVVNFPARKYGTGPKTAPVRPVRSVGHDTEYNVTYVHTTKKKDKPT